MQVACGLLWGLSGPEVLQDAALQHFGSTEALEASGHKCDHTQPAAKSSNYKTRKRSVAAHSSKTGRTKHSS